MSNVVDNRVVQVEFENSKFEKNINQSQKSVKDFNDSLNFSESSKNVSLLERAFHPLTRSIGEVSSSFSVMEVAAITTISNIVSNLESMTWRFAKSLSFDQVSAGFSKYEEKTRSVQTIMNATGETIDVVNGQLEKLMWFSDETSYSFTDMTNNVGKFTSAGVGLEDSVTAMMGISTWAAVSGAGIAEASRAMYNLSQAMGMGKVTAMDWKSIENANMATREFKQQAIDAAVELGTLTQKTLRSGEVVYQTARKFGKVEEVSAEKFRDTLSKGWFDSEVLMKTLMNYGGYADELFEYCQEHGVMATEGMDALKESTDALVKATDWKFFEELGMGGQAFKNLLLDKALGPQALAASVDKAGNHIYTVVDENGKKIQVSAKKFEDALKKGLIDKGSLVDAMNDYFGDYADMYLEMLADFGVEAAQTAESFSDGAMSIGEKAFRAAQEAKTLTDAIEAVKDAVSSTWMTTFEKLFGNYEEAKGLFTDIAEYLLEIFLVGSEARNEALEDWHNDELYGYAAAVEALRFAFEQLKKIFSAFGDVYKEVIGEFDLAGFAKNAVKSFQKFAVSLYSLNDGKNQKKLENLLTIFRGILNVFKILKNLVKAVFGGITKSLGKSGGLLDGFIAILAKVFGWFTKLSESMEDVDFFGKLPGMIRDIYDRFVELTGVDPVKFFKGLWDTIKGTILKFVPEKASGFLDFIKNLPETIKNIDPGATAEWLAEKWENLKGLPGIIKGFFEKLGELDFSGVQEFFRTLLGLDKKVFDPDSPMEKLKDVFGKVLDAFGAIISKVGDFVKGLKDIDFATIIKSIGMIAGVVIIGLKVKAWIDAVQGIGNFFDCLGDMIDGFNQNNLRNVVLRSVLPFAIAFYLVVSAITKLGTAITKENTGGFIAAAVGLVVFIGLIIGMCALMQKYGGENFNKAGLSILALAVSVMIMAKAVEMMAHIGDNGGSWDAALISLIAIGGVMAGLIVVMGKYGDGAKMGLLTTLALAKAMRIMVSAVEKLGAMDTKQLVQGTTAVLILLTALALFSKIYDSGAMDMKVAASIISLSVSLIILAGAIYIIGKAIGMMAEMENFWGGFGKFAAALGLLLAALALGSTIAGPILALSTAFGVFALSILGLGAGFLMFAKALAIFAVMGPLAGVALKSIVSALSEVLPTLASGFAVAFTEFIAALSEVSGVLFIAIGGMIESFLIMLEGLVPRIAEFIVMMISAILEILDTYMEPIVDSVASIIVKIIKGLAARVPDIVEILVNMLIDILNLLTDYAEPITEAVFELLSAILVSLTEHTVEFTDLAVDMILALMQGIADSTDRLLDGVFEMVSAIVEAIMDSMDDFTQLGFDIIIRFMRSMRETIDQNVPMICEEAIALAESIINAIWNVFQTQNIITSMIGEKLITPVLNGIQNMFSKIKKKAKELIDKAKEGINTKWEEMKTAGKNIIDGLIAGFKAKINEIKSNALNVGQIIVDAIKKFFGIASPSKLMKKMGGYVGEGFAIGIGNESRDVEIASDKLGKGALSAVAAAVDGIDDILTDDLTSPVIAPVLDLSNIEQGAGAIDGMFGGLGTIGAAGYNQASRVRTYSSENVQNGGAPQTVVNLTVTQPSEAWTEYLFDKFNVRLAGVIR